jgi:hypothetical protein
MTQPAEAVGGETNAVPSDNLEDIIASHLEADETFLPDEEPAAEQAEEEVSEEEQSDEDLIEAEEIPPIDLPPSWKAEEKERWDNLPRETQEYLSQRESQREKFVQSKAQEAAQARQQAETAALQHLEAHYRQTEQVLSQYAQQFEPQQPDPSLIVTNPQLYAQQEASYRYQVAQQQQLQHQSAQARAEAERAEQALQQQTQQAEIAYLAEHFPEYLSPENGPKLQQELSAIATELGYPPELISQARAQDIIAMHKVATIKAKADKFDALMAKKMEKVRAAKKLPPVATPGVSNPDGVKQRQRNEAESRLRGGSDADLNAYLRTII